MPQRCEDAFGCIESAQEFLTLLTEAISETKQDVDAEIHQIQEQLEDGGSRRPEALRIASYDLELLEHHMRRSKRIVNDLCMVRRILLEQRGVPKEELPAVPSPLPPVRIMLPVRPPHIPARLRLKQRTTQEELVKVAAA